MAENTPQQPEQNTEKEPQPDWKIKVLYSQAWQIVKKHKVLWLFGLALGGGLSVNSRNNLDQKDLERFQNLFQNNQNSNADLSMVLGAATNGFQDIMASIFAAIPVYFYVIAGIEVVLLIAAVFTINIIYASWAEAGLIEGIQTALANGTVTIRESSEKAFRSIKGIAWIRFIPIIIFIIAASVSFPILSIFSFLGPFSELLLFALIVFFIFVFILITFSQTWAVRKVAIEHLSAKQAFREGYHISLKKFWSMLGLGIVNILLRIGIGIAIVLIIIGPIIGLSFAGFSLVKQDPQVIQSFIVPFSLLVAVLVTAFMIASEVTRGILSAFINTVWSLAYKNIKGKYDK